MKIIKSKASIKETRTLLGEVGGRKFFKTKVEVVDLERSEPDTKYIVTPDVIRLLSSMLHPDVWAEDAEGNFYQM